ncbi:MAG: aspartate aminotransferase family protein [Thermoplasmata archaeon]
MANEKYIEEYMRRTPKSRETYERAARKLAGGAESNIRLFKPYPVYMTHGRGQFIYDVDGNEYIDLICGMGSIILGHNDPEVRAAVIERVTKGGDVLGTPTELAIEYIERVQRAFPSMELCRFSNSGTEATMNCIRIARAYSGKDVMVKAEGAYHGGHDYALHALHLTEKELNSNPKRPPCLPYGSGIPKLVTQNLVKVIPYNDAEATAEILEENQDKIGCMILEPVMGGGGLIIPKDDYLKKVRKITEKLGIVLIFDEVLTGFRIAYGGGQERFNVKPDMTALSKIAGGGFQMACIGGKREIMEMILPKVQGTAAEVSAGMTNAVQVGTYNGHPTSLAAGAKTIEILGRAGTYEYLNKISDMLWGGLKDLLDDKKIVGSVNYIGPLGTIYFDCVSANTWRETFSLNEEKWTYFFFGMMNRGVYLGIPHCDERFFLSKAHTEEDIQRVLDIADEVLSEMKREFK